MLDEAIVNFPTHSLQDKQLEIYLINEHFPLEQLTKSKIIS